MSFGRIALSTLVMMAGVAVAFVLVPRALNTLHALHALELQRSPTPQKAAVEEVGRHTGDRPGGAAPTASAGQARRTSADSSVALLGTVAIHTAWALLALAALMLLLVARRAHRRRQREYALYQLHLSTHDQAKRQDLEDMVEALANVVRVWLPERLRNGQPYLAIELICGVAPAHGGPLEMEWSLNVRCEPASAKALDAAISAAYPDVRLGRVHGEQPRPRPGVLREPGYLLRFRKERSFVYSLIADGDEEASAPLEQIARAQVAVEAPTVVRFQLTPTPSYFEALARRLYRRQENKLVRREHLGLREGGLTSTFNRAEMRSAERTQNRSLFWLETVVAADSPEACKAVASALQSRRGENRLQRRWMTMRHRLYRRRFPRALGPLIPSFRTLVSAAEVAHLLELPSARMKGVPVRRIPLPRIPAPPEAIRGNRPRRPGAGGRAPGDLDGLVHGHKPDIATPGTKGAVV